MLCIWFQWRVTPSWCSIYRLSTGDIWKNCSDMVFTEIPKSEGLKWEPSCTAWWKKHLGKQCLGTFSNSTLGLISLCSAFWFSVKAQYFFPTNFVPKTCHDIFPGDCSKFTNSLYNSIPLIAPEKPFSKLLAPEYVLDLSYWHNLVYMLFHCGR